MKTATIPGIILTVMLLVVLTAPVTAAGGCCGSGGSQPPASPASCHASAGQAQLEDIILVGLDGDTFAFGEVVGTGPIALVCMRPDSTTKTVALAVQDAWSQPGGGSGIRIWGIGCGTHEQVAAYAVELELGYPVLVDPDCSLLGALGVTACPGAVFISEAGRIVKVTDNITEVTMAEGIEEASRQNEFVDPVCKMTVTKEGAAATYEYDGKTYYFCNVGCKETFAEEPGKYLGE